MRIVSDQPDEYTGKKGLVKTQVFTCQDLCPSGARLKDNFDYVLSEPEKEKYAGKMLDKEIELDVIELRPPPFGTRLRSSGRIYSTPLDKK
ncbi:MAG TPA: hypothetical protein VHG71_06585 [Verrucomicrobiae bacterium]|nr:hypothetical protein [Verrucomicrobiae bacterium]